MLIESSDDKKGTLITIDFDNEQDTKEFMEYCKQNPDLAFPGLTVKYIGTVNPQTDDVIRNDILNDFEK